VTRWPDYFPEQERAVLDLPAFPVEAKMAPIELLFFHKST